jgi:hypothetical protein
MLLARGVYQLLVLSRGGSGTDELGFLTLLYDKTTLPSDKPERQTRAILALVLLYGSLDSSVLRA